MYNAWKFFLIVTMHDMELDSFSRISTSHLSCVATALILKLWHASVHHSTIIYGIYVWHH